MKVLIVYDSVSISKMTASVAKTISEVMKEKKLEVNAVHVTDADADSVKKFDCVLAGAPTMAFKPSRGIMQFLNNLPANVSGKLAAAFDTQVKSRLSGSAVKDIEGKLKGRGFKLISPPLVTYVELKEKATPQRKQNEPNTENEWQLKEGELEKVKMWSQEVSETLSKLD
jgi:flavodoxin